MKLGTPDNRRARTPLRIAFSLVACALVPLLAYAAAPAWWSERGVLITDAAPDDYAPANQGQLKNIAAAAVAEMEVKLTGGAGDELRALVGSWSAAGAQANDFAPVNLGQLKNVATPFYERLSSAGYASEFPWRVAPNPADDFAVANIGQVKALFAFDFTPTKPGAVAAAKRLATSWPTGTLALDRRGSLWKWGEMSNDWNTVIHKHPVPFDAVTAVGSVTAGYRHQAVLRKDGTVWTWGKNSLGQLGDGTTIDRSVPEVVPGLANIVAVEAGESSYTLALHNDGTVFAWGDNYYGTLGVPDIAHSTVPLQVPGLSDIRTIAAGSGHSLAIKNDGTLWTWGYISYNWGDESWSATPTLVEGLQSVVNAAAGYEHLLAVQADGTVWSWGSNWSNALGTSGSTWGFQATPSQVPGPANVVSVAAASNHSFAVGADGSLWAWGENNFGQLGDGTMSTRPAPVQITGITDVVAVAASSNYTIAMRKDGSVWGWGWAVHGTLPGADPLIPQQITLGLLDTNRNGIDDRWELEHFGNLDQTADGDFDGDGTSNLAEIRRGTDPTDYFNGTPPSIEIVSGNNQIADSGTFLAQPLTVRVRNAAGELLVNAPVSFKVSSGSGELFAALGAAPSGTELSVRTGSSGEATAYYLLLDAPGVSSRITAAARTVTTVVSRMFRAVARYVQPAPTPPPGGSPPPSPTPTPTPPYRYALINLGKEVYPHRVNNNGTILVSGPDASNPAGWSYGRWRAGKIDSLSCPFPNSSFSVKDINDRDTVVGNFYPPELQGPWDEGDLIEHEAGLRWPANRSEPDKLSAPGDFPGTGPHDWYLRFKTASLTAINNGDEVSGRISTETVAGFLWSRILLVNSARWPAGATAPVQMSDLSATSDAESGFTGSSDTIVRANSAGHYIGSKVTPDPNLFLFRYFDGIRSGMIDGQAIEFDPIDLNEGGVVIGTTTDFASMIIRTLVAPPAAPVADTMLHGVYPVAINDHVRSRGQGATPSGALTQPEAEGAAPQILSWDGNALVLRERQADGSTWHPFGLEEMIPNMDGWEYLSPHDMNDSGVIIGTGWFTDPANPQAEGEVHGCALVPVGFRARDPYTDNSGTQIEPINQGFDPRVTKENPWPWASVVKGGVSNVVKLVLPGNAAQMRLVVKAQGSGPAEVQVKEHGAQEPPAQELAGLKDGDNLIELIGLMGSNEVTEASVEVHLSEAQGADTGEVVAKLNVMALPPRTVSVGIYRVGDDRPLQGSTEPRAKLPLTPANEEIRTELNNLFAQAGISFTISAESKPIPNVAFDDNSNGAVDGPELDTIEAAAESVTAPLRVVLADKKGLKSTGELFPRGVNLDAPGACLVFVRDSGEHTATIAGHELGHILNLSFYTRDSEMHDPGPFPSGTEGLMQPGRGVDHPEMGRWLGHDDWRVANETAKTKFK